MHEFGHYNNLYYCGYDGDQHYITSQEDCTDTAEVHSQGFELLFSHFYPEIFGEDTSLAESYLHRSLLWAIVTGALYDEFQQYAYAAENVTLIVPCYYISYATSAAGAYTFWNEALNDYFGAADKYLQFVALEPETGFQRSFEAAGMTNPLSEGYLRELSETLHEKLELPEEPDSGSSVSPASDKLEVDGVPQSPAA